MVEAYGLITTWLRHIGQNVTRSYHARTRTRTLLTPTRNTFEYYTKFGDYIFGKKHTKINK